LRSRFSLLYGENITPPEKGQIIPTSISFLIGLPSFQFYFFNFQILKFQSTPANQCHCVLHHQSLISIHACKPMSLCTTSSIINVVGGNLTIFLKNFGTKMIFLKTILNWILTQNVGTKKIIISYF